MAFSLCSFILYRPFKLETYGIKSVEQLRRKAENVIYLKNIDGSQKISGEQLKDLYKSFVSEYPIVSIEDPFDQDDWEHYSKMTRDQNHWRCMNMMVMFLSFLHSGVYEALELGDGGSDYLGKGVSKDPTDQVGIDNFMVHQLDGTQNQWLWCKQKFGMSLAACKAGAGVMNIPFYKHISNIAGNKKLVLPVPGFNVINGGHAGNKLAMQEFMVLPFGASSFKECFSFFQLLIISFYAHLHATILRFHL